MTREQALSSKPFRIVALILLAAIGGGIYVAMHWGEESTDDAAIEAHVVTISPKVAGYVKTLSVADNQPVKAGDVILEIDTTDYLIRRDRAKAALAAATAAYHASGRSLETTRISAPSNLDAAKAQVDSAQANWNKAANDLSRMQHLSVEARSAQQLDEAVAAEKTARFALEDAKARLRSAETAPKTIAGAQAQADQLEAQAKGAEADLASAENDLANTKITAPMDGYITKRGVEQGDYVQPGQSLGFIVGSDFWVTANFKETQLEHMQKGQKASIHLDAFPGHDLSGTVDSIQAGSGARFSTFPPENATGNYVKVVQRVPVKILLNHPDPSLPIGPGLSVVPTVYTR